jgi:hypothetical protein
LKKDRKSKNKEKERPLLSEASNSTRYSNDKWGFPAAEIIQVGSSKRTRENMADIRHIFLEKTTLETICTNYKQKNKYFPDLLEFFNEICANWPN